MKTNALMVLLLALLGNCSVYAIEEAPGEEPVFGYMGEGDSVSNERHPFADEEAQQPEQEPEEDMQDIEQDMQDIEIKS